MFNVENGLYINTAYILFLFFLCYSLFSDRNVFYNNLNYFLCSLNFHNNIIPTLTLTYYAFFLPFLECVM